MTHGIETESQLDELLARPSEPDLEAVGAIKGSLLILGAGGKMGPSLALRAARAARQAGSALRVIGVSRFTNGVQRKLLTDGGVQTIAADLLDKEHLAALPEAENVVFMAARKFGSTGNESLTWAMNAWLPAEIAQRFNHSRIVAFSSGNVYPFVPVSSGGATEDTPPSPVGEYAQSVLARERIFEYFSRRYGTPGVLLRLNYAVELRYGVLVDIARKVWDRRTIDLSTGYVNVIWQGDANSICLRSFALCSTPPAILNLTGPETLSVREVALEFGRRFEIEPRFAGKESTSVLLNNPALCLQRFGPPSVTAAQSIDWTAGWILRGGPSLDRPTHFEVRDGRF